jgi:hypothetical protein
MIMTAGDNISLPDTNMIIYSYMMYVEKKLLLRTSVSEVRLSTRGI